MGDIVPGTVFADDADLPIDQIVSMLLSLGRILTMYVSFAVPRDHLLGSLSHLELRVVLCTMCGVEMWDAGIVVMVVVLVNVQLCWSEGR